MTIPSNFKFIFSYLPNMSELVTISMRNAAGETISWKLDLERGTATHDFIRDHLDRHVPYEPDVSGFLVRALRPGDTFVDVGANLGWFTCLAASAVGLAGNVFAFEPGAENVRELESNLQCNAFSNVQLVPKVVSDFAGAVDFYINGENSGGNALWDPQHFPGNAPAKTIERIDSVTLDGYFDSRTERIRVLKIDTEGAEEKILRGAESLLRLGRIDFVVAELHEMGLQELGSNQMTLRNFMASIGFECYLMDYSGQYPRHIQSTVPIQSRLIVNLLFCTPQSLTQVWSRCVVNEKTLQL